MITKYWPNKKGEISNSEYVTGSKFPPLCWVKNQIYPFLLGQNPKFTPFYRVNIQNLPLFIGSKFKIWSIFCKCSSLSEFQNVTFSISQTCWDTLYNKLSSTLIFHKLTPCIAVQQLLEDPNHYYPSLTQVCVHLHLYAPSQLLSLKISLLSLVFLICHIFFRQFPVMSFWSRTALPIPCFWHVAFSLFKLILFCAPLSL